MVTEEAGSQHSLVPSPNNTLDREGETDTLTFERLYVCCVQFQGRLPQIRILRTNILWVHNAAPFQRLQETLKFIDSFCVYVPKIYFPLPTCL